MGMIGTSIAVLYYLANHGDEIEQEDLRDLREVDTDGRSQAG